MSSFPIFGHRLFVRIALLLAALGTTACKDDPTAPVVPETTPQEPRSHWIPEGVYEITVTGLGTGEMRASAKRVDASGNPSGAPGMQAGLSEVVSGLDFEQSSTGSFIEGSRSQGGYRYVTITYRIRNGTGGTLSNLTLIPCIANITIPGTPIYRIYKFDGSSADTAMAKMIIPTGAVGLGDDIGVRPLYPDVLQVFTEAEVAGVPLPTDVTSLLPYGYMVRNRLNPVSRAIPAATGINDYSGVVTFALRVPLSSLATTDVFTLVFWVSAFQDSETRITESIEEAMDTAAVRRVDERAAAIGATTTTVLAGSPAAAASFTRYPGKRQICSVRTAGTAASPVTYITAPGPYSQVLLLYPGESMYPCAPYFRTGTPGRPATGVPFDIGVRAADRYGNVKTMVTDTVSIEQSPDGPSVSLPSPQALVAGAATMSVTYNAYGNGTLYAVAKRMRGGRDVSVYGVTRTWTAGAGTTNWSTGGNWAGGAVPMEDDGVVIAAAAPLDPQLTSNVSIWEVTVEDGASIALGAYSMVAAGNVSTGVTGGITSTTGTMSLSGSYKTVQGILPKVRVTNAYSLSGNLAVKAPLVVEGAPLTDNGYKLSVSN